MDFMDYLRALFDRQNFSALHTLVIAVFVFQVLWLLLSIFRSQKWKWYFLFAAEIATVAFFCWTLSLFNYGLGSMHGAMFSLFSIFAFSFKLFCTWALWLKYRPVPAPK